MTNARVDHQPAYVLHTKPYLETSLLVDVLTLRYGRLLLLARGARRPRSDLRSVLLPFQPLTLCWFGKNEVKTLHRAQWHGGLPQLKGAPLLCGFYINELMIKLTTREDPDSQIFILYDEAVRALVEQKRLAVVLRRYEYQLLQALGYAPNLLYDHQETPIRPEQSYLCRGSGAPELDAGQVIQERCVEISGASLLAIAAYDYHQSRTRTDARVLLQLWISELLGNTPLISRELLQVVSNTQSLSSCG